MQVSGIRVEIDARKKPRLIDNNGVLREDGDRVVKLEVLGADGQWEAVDPAKEYTLATSDWTAGGGDKYVVLKNGSFVSLEQFIMESTAEYIRHLGEMRAEVEGRITIIR
jgi:5'-nucleotidase